MTYRVAVRCVAHGRRRDGPLHAVDRRDGPLHAVDAHREGARGALLQGGLAGARQLPTELHRAKTTDGAWLKGGDPVRAASEYDEMYATGYLGYYASRQQLKQADVHVVVYLPRHKNCSRHQRTEASRATRNATEQDQVHAQASETDTSAAAAALVVCGGGRWRRVLGQDRPQGQYGGAPEADLPRAAVPSTRRRHGPSRPGALRDEDSIGRVVDGRAHGPRTHPARRGDGLHADDTGRR